MLKSGGIWTITALVLALTSAGAQGEPATQLYQIVSGNYFEEGGFVPFPQLLPSTSDAFVELTLDTKSKPTQIRFLGRDMQTVLSIRALAPGQSNLAYVFTNGTIFPDHIKFELPLPPAMPDQPSISFTVSNSMNTLRINGKISNPAPGSFDVPTTFVHANVVAVLMPAAAIGAIGVNDVAVCWPAATNRNYQVQYRSTLTNAWAALGATVAGNGSTNRITDHVPPGLSERYYRVLIAP